MSFKTTEMCFIYHSAILNEWGKRKKEPQQVLNFRHPQVSALPLKYLQVIEPMKEVSSDTTNRLLWCVGFSPHTKNLYFPSSCSLRARNTLYSLALSSKSSLTVGKLLPISLFLEENSHSETKSKKKKDKKCMLLKEVNALISSVRWKLFSVAVWKNKNKLELNFTSCSTQG